MDRRRRKFKGYFSDFQKQTGLTLAMIARLLEVSRSHISMVDGYRREMSPDLRDKYHRLRELLYPNKVFITNLMEDPDRPALEEAYRAFFKLRARRRSAAGYGEKELDTYRRSFLEYQLQRESIRMLQEANYDDGDDVLYKLLEKEEARSKVLAGSRGYRRYRFLEIRLKILLYAQELFEQSTAELECMLAAWEASDTSNPESNPSEEDEAPRDDDPTGA